MPWAGGSQSETRKPAWILFAWLEPSSLSTAFALLVFRLGHRQSCRAGGVYQAERAAADLAGFPPPGRMISVNGVNLHLYCMGSGSPTLVLEARGSDKDVEAEKALARIQQAEQDDLARLSSHSRHIVVQNSGHFIILKTAVEPHKSRSP